jgi:glycerophosphoryl diester phosphodiesterase
MTASPRRPLLLGHRGARGLKAIPENTVASFDLALAEGCDGFEFDVRLTADGQAVICHDAKVGKLSIARTTAEQLAGLPRLAEIIERYPSAFFDIELKVEGLETILTSMLRSRASKNFVVSSFLPAVLREVHRLDASLPLGLICETAAQLRSWRDLPLTYVIPYHALATTDLIDNVHGASGKILVWTVNTTAAMKRFASWGVDGIISDYPKRLTATFQ